MTRIKAPLPAWIDDIPQMVAEGPSREPPQWFVDIYSEFQREQRALLVPNRLKGTTINQDGDAT